MFYVLFVWSRYSFFLEETLCNWALLEGRKTSMKATMRYGRPTILIVFHSSRTTTHFCFALKIFATRAPNSAARAGSMIDGSRAMPWRLVCLFPPAFVTWTLSHRFGQSAIPILFSDRKLRL